MNRFISMSFLLLCHILPALAFAQNNAINGFEIPVLSPRPIAVSGVQQPLISLNGEWDFKLKGSAKAGKIKVPGEWVMQGYTVNEGETALYSRQLMIPADWNGKVIKLRFDAVSSHAVVKVNDKIVGKHEGGFVPFEVDLTSAVTTGNNLLEVEVQAQTVGDKLACTSQYAVHTVGGLLRKVTLFVLPQTHLTTVTAETVFDKNFKNAVLQLNTAVHNLNNQTSLLYTLRDNNGKIIAKKNSKNIGQVENINVPNPNQWNPEHPYLYQLTTDLIQNGTSIETVNQNIGFRQVAVKGNRVFVNGKPIKLHGVNRHSVHPLTGRAVAPELDLLDAQLFREANCNFIRTSHYPPSEEFLNACDSLGLFVESESALCWIQHHASPIWKKWNYLDEQYLPLMATANIENVLAGKNHPSVILWSLGNESRWSPLWEKVNALVKKLDPSRPTIFHDQCWGGFNNASSKADIANYHYPGTNGARATDTMSRPVLFGEYAHLSTYNRRELLSDPGVRAAYGEPLVNFYDSMYYHNACLGGAIWSGIDDVFHLPDGRIVGYGPWGPLDAWRRKKPEYWGMKKAYTPVRVKNVNFNSSQEGYAELEVENRYDFTSLNQIKINVLYSDGTTKAINSSIAARGSGLIRVPVKSGTDHFKITFSDPRGFVANEERYIIKKDAEQIVDATKTKVEIQENEGAIEVLQNGITYLFSKTKGVITSVKKGDEVLLTQGPEFSVIPMNSEDGGKPNVAGETYQNNIYPAKGYPLYNIFASDITTTKTDSGVNINAAINFSDGSTGAVQYVFNGNSLLIKYEVTYKGNQTKPYQYGLLMQLPKTFDKLSWDRKGSFTTYPENDIARTNGSAMLNAKQTTGVEEWRVVPKGDWKDDANEWGSNDFRSTKHQIITASLQESNGNQIAVKSDGTQASRSWLQDGTIHWLIADYCNNGSEPFYGSPFTNGRIDIKDKVLKGCVVIKF